MEKGVLRNYTKFTGKDLCQSLFFSKVTSSRSATSLKKRLWYKCFPVNFAKFLRTPFLQNTSGRLLLIFEEIDIDMFSLHHFFLITMHEIDTAVEVHLEPFHTYMIEFFL